MDAYDGEANVVIRGIDIQNGTAKAQADIWLRGLDSYGDVVDFSVVSQGTSRLVASGVPLDSAGRTTLPPFEVPLSGGPSSAYPHDRYHVSMRLDVAIPEGVQLPPLTGQGRLDRRLLLAVNYVWLDVALTDWALQANTTCRILTTNHAPVPTTRSASSTRST